MNYFTCETVDVALAVVNGKGASDFTPQSSITVHGGNVDSYIQ